MAGDEYGGADDGRVITRLNAESSGVLEQTLTQFLSETNWTTNEPLLGDFIAFLRQSPVNRSAWEQERCDTFAARLSNYAHGLRGRAFNRASTFNIADGTSIAIGLGEYASAYENNLTAVFAAIFTAARRAMRQMNGRLLVVCDEAHHAFEDKKAAGVLDDMIREGRAFGCGVVLASQQPADFMNGVGETLAGLAETKIILSLDPSVRDRAQEVFELSGEQVDVLTHNNEPGLAVLWTPTQNALIRVWPGADLLSSITTDAHGARHVSRGAA
jgi:type IV secretory pathway VirB4 component